MNDIETCCIESRRKAIFSSYDVKNPGTIKMIDDFFDKVREFSRDCKDVQDFETKFATSSLNKEYTELFSMVMQTETDSDGNAPVVNEEEEYTLQDEINDDVKRAVRRKARQDVYDVARDVPVLGEAMTAKQHFDFFSRFRKGKK